jgi:hypothetical protein
MGKLRHAFEGSDGFGVEGGAAGFIHHLDVDDGAFGVDDGHGFGGPRLSAAE